MWIQALRVTNKDEWASTDGSPIRIPDLVLLFGPTDGLRNSPAPARLADLYPQAVQLGCSSGTTVSELQLADEMICAVAIGFDRTKVRIATRALPEAASSRDAGLAIGQELAAPDLVGVFVLSDGLGVNGSALVDGLVAACGENVSISGGLAGDGARFADTLVMVGGQSAAGVVAAIGFYGPAIRIGYGSAGGWDEFGPVRKVTRSRNTMLLELDGKPALNLYERYLGDEAANLPASGLFYPLKIWDPALPGDEVVRTVLSIDREARTMTFAGDIPEGWHARLMRGSFDRLTDGAAEAARLAKADLGDHGASPELCLFVSCVGRRLLMGQRTEEELEAVAHILGDTALITGFYSYGEIAPNSRSGACGLHNQTVTLTLLTEAA